MGNEIFSVGAAENDDLYFLIIFYSFYKPANVCYQGEIQHIERRIVKRYECHSLSEIYCYPVITCVIHHDYFFSKGHCTLQVEKGHLTQNFTMFSKLATYFTDKIPLTAQELAL